MQLHDFVWMVALFLLFLVWTLWNKKNDPKSHVQFKHHKEACCLFVYVACIYVFDSASDDTAITPGVWGNLMLMSLDLYRRFCILWTYTRLHTNVKIKQCF